MTIFRKGCGKCCDPKKCCCVPGVGEEPARWEVNKTESECDELGGFWAECPIGGCPCPPCVPQIMVNGINIVGPQAIIDGLRPVVCVGLRNPALHPFGYPVQGNVVLDTALVQAFGFWSWSCETNTLVVSAYLVADLRAAWNQSSGVVYQQGQFYSVFDLLVGSYWSREWTWVYQGTPEPGPCFGESGPPLVTTNFVDRFPGPDETFQPFIDENAGCGSVLLAEPTVSIGCAGDPPICSE